MKVIYLIFIFYPFILFGQQNPALVDKIRLDPRASYGASASELFDQIQYIPLETKKESMFGAINNLQVSKNYFVFFDFDTKAILIFTKEGKYMAKISKIPIPGWDKNEYYPLSQFIFDKTSEKIYVSCRDKSKPKRTVLLFNTKGELLNEYDFSKLGLNLSDRFAVLPDNQLLFANTFNLPPSSKGFYFYKVKNFSHLTDSVIRLRDDDLFVKRNANRGYTTLSSNTDIPIWSRNSEYSFWIAEGKDFKKYELVFPQNLVLDSFKYKESSFFNSIEKVWEYCRSNKLIEELTGIGYSKHYLLFRTLSGGASNMEDNFILSLASKSLYCFDKITPDSLSFFLPLGNFSINTFSDGYIYNEVSSFQMFNAEPDAKKYIDQSEPVLRDFFKSQNRKSNPVIVALKLKADL